MELQQRQVTVAGVRSPVRLAGPQESTEAIVFVHGNPGSSEDWIGLMQEAGKFARAVAPDMPGYGKADRPRDFDYTVAGYARHLDGLLSELGIERVHLVLHDFGGPWGLEWASEHTGRVRSVTLINIGVLRGYRWHKFARIWQTPVLGEIFQLIARRGVFRAAMNADNPKPFPTAFLDRMFDDSDWGMKRAVLKLYRATRKVDALSQEQARKLAPARLPALIVWGKGDAYLPYSFASTQGDIFDVEAVHVLEGCGHWPFIDEPEKVAAILMPYLKKRWAAG